MRKINNLEGFKIEDWNDLSPSFRVNEINAIGAFDNPFEHVALLQRSLRYDVSNDATPSSPISCRSFGPLASRRPSASRKLS